jgi:hypothetical protein
VKAVAISGSPRSPSKSKALAERLLEELATLGCDTQMIDVATLPAALLTRAPSPEMDRHRRRRQSAHRRREFPTYRALCGTLKCFFDLMPRLTPKQAHHRPATGIPSTPSPEYGLRLFASLEGGPSRPHRHGRRVRRRPARPGLVAAATSRRVP